LNFYLILSIFLAYSAVLFTVSIFTSRKAGNKAYFLGNRQSPWPVVAYGMVGASLSGVTFISIPGWVGSSSFTYLMVVFGYLAGYFAITFILLPLYYKLNLTSIYTYLNQRFGYFSHKTGAFFFIISRLIGASFRMFLVINVLQLFIFDHLGIPFWASVLLFLFLITVYSFKGGIKTIVWTDMLQTTFMLASLLIIITIILRQTGYSVHDMIQLADEKGLSKILETDWKHDRFYLKQFFSGMFITIVMTGLDQDMMQKNLSCRSLKDAQKNMISLGFILIPVNLLFLFLGASLYLYAEHFAIDIPQLTDELFPMLALQHFGLFAGIIFFIGLIAAAYSSADSAITALTTSLSIDFLNLEGKGFLTEIKQIRLRYVLHFFITSLVFLTIVLFSLINNQAVIALLFTIAGYTYGPLLGLFAFGLISKATVHDRWVPLIAIVSPLICYFLSKYSEQLLWGYKFGFELLILNGLLTFAGLWIIVKPKTTNNLNN
jgi:Na+/proline symporter